jgi:shikimate dehydrogenase
MIHLGLTGWPVSHSFSPKMHNAAFRDLGLAGEYSLYPVRPGDSSAMINLVNLIRQGRLTGLNVTIPHKQAIIPLLDRLTPSADAIGAVNTLYIENGQLVGHNTDAPGFLADLHKVNIAGIKLETGKALVLGAGGSARSVVWALASDSRQVLLAARNVERAKILVESLRLTNIELDIEVIPMTPEALISYRDRIDLIVNTTPVGMSPDVEFSPWPEGVAFPDAASVYDLIYNPRETLLVKQARMSGLNATTGLGMLVEQAALGFKIWTGCEPSRNVMLSSLEE